MLKSVLKKIWIVLCLTFIFIICDYALRYASFAVLNSSFIFGLAGTNLIAILISSVFLNLLWVIAGRNKSAYWPLVFISSAALSNILDRIFYGGVIDYITLPLVPKFNISDLVIVLGLIFVAKALIYGKPIKRIKL